MISFDDINPNRAIALFLLFFLLLLLPILAQVSTYHSDEHYYTDSAVYMVQHDDYLSPRLTDGTLRTKKPILTYWMIIAGYAVFGINFFAARLPFLLAGCFTLWLTYQIALQLFKQQRVAFLSTIILASNLQFLMLCLRATPDVLQVLFMNVSLLGFIAIAFNNDGRLRNYLFLYIGAALVVQTKGLLGLVLVGFLFTYYFWVVRKARHTTRITHWPAMVVGIVIAVSWYAYVLFQYGEGALLGFYTDQVGGKISTSKFYIVTNLWGYLWGVFRNFLPWSFILVAGYVAQRRSVHEAVKQHRAAVVFILSWFVLLLAIFIGSSDCRTRYLAPAYPMIAILVSKLFWQVFKNRHIQKIWKGLSIALLVVLATGSVALLAIGVLLSWKVAVGGLILVGCCATAISSWRRNHGGLSPVAMGIVLLVTLAVPRSFVLSVFEFEPSKRLAACILAKHPSGQPIDVWALKRANYLAQLYTVSQGRIVVRYFKRGALPQHLERRPLVVLNQKEKASYHSNDYMIEACGPVFRTPALDILWQSLLARKRGMAFAAMQEPLYLAKRK